MSIFRSAIRAGIAIKVAQIAKRELSKPENQRKIKEGLNKVKDAAKRRQGGTNAGL
jgi:hypothetical protein